MTETQFIKPLFFFAIAVQLVNRQESTITIQADQAKDMMSKHSDRHFAEHLMLGIYERFFVGKNYENE